MPSLFVVRGRDQGKHFQLSSPIMKIGRETSSDVQLFDSEASRTHAEIRVETEGGCELLDLGSSNGTRINGQRVVRQQIVQWRSDRDRLHADDLHGHGSAQRDGCGTRNRHRAQEPGG